jgi:protein O-GlcNAc transferase
VPVVSYAGRDPVTRVGCSILSNVGLPELVATSYDGYVQAAVRLASDLPALAAMRDGMRHRMQTSVLMDAPRFARNLESAYRDMWRAWCTRT